MGRITLIVFILLSAVRISAQEQWENLPTNPNITSSVYDIEMLDGKVFQIYYQNVIGVDKIIVDFYQPKTMSWQNLTSIPSSVISLIKTEQINGVIYVMAYDNASFQLMKLDQGASSLTNFTNPYPFVGANNNWEFHAGKNDNEFYVLYTDGTGPSQVHGIEYTLAGDTWTHMSENSSQNLANATMRIQSTINDVYFGVYSNKVRLTRFAKGNINTIFAYDGGLTGEVFSSGTTWSNNGFVLTGNKTDLPFFYGTEDANNKSYEVVIDGNTIDINLTSTSTTFNLDTFNIASESSPSHSFIFSNFSNDGVGTPHEQIGVIRRDLTVGGSPWELLGPLLLPIATALDPNSMHLGIDNSGNHIAAAYTIAAASSNEIKVSNNQPYHLVGSINPNSGICSGKLNEIYTSIQLMDEDYDQVDIISAVSNNGTTTGLVIIPNGFINGISKFKIFGIPAVTSDDITITYTDGYNTYTSILGSFTGNTTPINLQFISNPVKFCSNERQVELSEYVNYYDQGNFRINGQDLVSTIVNATSLSPINGTLRYTVNVNGCFVTAIGNYTIVTAPSVSVTTTPTTCGLSTGNATAIITPGTSGNVSLQWSTGQQNLTISNLSPGPYYAHIKDDNNCHSTALASVETSNIVITETIVEPVCAGVKSGSITLNITGTSDYQVVWSNGKVGDAITNLKAGNYEFTLYDATGCEIKRSYILTSPSALKSNFNVVKPDCGASNGGLQANVSGGTSPYTYAWSNGGTTNLQNNLQQGFYALQVTDNLGCIFKDSSYLNEKLAIEILDSVIEADCNLNNGGIDITLIQNALGDPVGSITWDNGVTTEDNFNLAGGFYLLSVLTTSNCLSQKLIQVTVKAPLRNEICVVTVDDATTTNLVVWEKIQTEGVSFYNIYRENADAGNYMWIDTVQFGSLSVFNDVIASPLQRSWRYRISAVNECGVEGPISNPHKTLHLNTINQVTPGVIDIYWDEYEGFIAAEYIVNRFSDQNGWEALTPAVPFGALTKFTDTPPDSLTNLDYYVSLNLAAPCTATFRSQDFNSSRSNKEKGIFNPGSGTGDSNNEVFTLTADNVSLQVSPNPFDDKIFIQLKGVSKTNVEIRDIHGKLISSSICYEGQNSISTTGISAGIYFVSTIINGTQKTIKIVK